MKATYIKVTYIKVTLIAASLVLAALPAAAQTGGTLSISANANVNASATMTAEITRADSMITDRINALTAMQSRINSMTRVSADQKTSLEATIQSQISDLNTLKAKIDADTDATVLKTDVQSITASLRIYALVMPQAAINAAADRALTIVDAMTTLGGKLQSRISALPAGTDTTGMVSAMTDFNAKVGDAKVQAQAAISGIANLKPDNGDATIKASNLAALKDARTKIHAAVSDFKTARQDVTVIVTGIKKSEASASVNANASTTGQ